MKQTDCPNCGAHWTLQEPTGNGELTCLGCNLTRDQAQDLAQNLWKSAMTHAEKHAHIDRVAGVLIDATRPQAVPGWGVSGWIDRLGEVAGNARVETANILWSGTPGDTARRVAVRAYNVAGMAGLEALHQAALDYQDVHAEAESQAYSRARMRAKLAVRKYRTP